MMRPRAGSRLLRIGMINRVCFAECVPAIQRFGQVTEHASLGFAPVRPTSTNELDRWLQPTISQGRDRAFLGLYNKLRLLLVRDYLANDPEGGAHGTHRTHGIIVSGAWSEADSCSLFGLLLR